MYGQTNLIALSKQTTSEDELCRLQLELVLGFPGLSCCCSVVFWNKYLKERSNFLEHFNNVD